MGGALNVAVGRFRLFGIYHAYVVYRFNGAGIAFYPVRIEYQYDLAPVQPPVVAHQVHEPAAGEIHVLLCDGRKVVPGENYVVPVYQQVLRPCFCGFREAETLGLNRYAGTECGDGIAADGAVGAFVYPYKLLLIGF